MRHGGIVLATAKRLATSLILPSYMVWRNPEIQMIILLGLCVAVNTAMAAWAVVDAKKFARESCEDSQASIAVELWQLRQSASGATGD